MGEESISHVYIGKYKDGHVVFEPLGEFEVTDMDVEAVNYDDVVAPMEYVRTITRDKTITVQAFLNLKGLRGFYKAIGMPEYLRTEYLFPKKKKRGTARRKRKIERATKKFIKFVHDKYGGDLIGTRATNVIIDDFFIPDDVIPPVEVESERTPICKFVISKDELPAFAGPFEGEEDLDE